ncbi:MAG: mandelate racemase/muconate lactonizing enzyme family protein, partial [Betaproteobacteria bacterium]
MRIERLEAEALSIPLNRDFGGATYHVTRRCTVITRVFGAGGIAAEVYNGDNRDHSPEIARAIREVLAPLVVGEDAFAIERLWAR